MSLITESAIITGSQLIVAGVAIRIGVARWRTGGWWLILLGLISAWSAAWTWFPGAYRTLRLAGDAVFAGALAIALVVNRRWDVVVLLGGGVLVTLVLFYIAMIASFHI